MGSHLPSYKWISNKLLLKNFLTDGLNKSLHTNEELHRKVKKHVQNLINRKIPTAAFLIFYRIQLSIDHLALLERTLQDLRLSLARNEFSLPGIISPKLNPNVRNTQNAIQRDHSVAIISNPSTFSVNTANANQIPPDENLTNEIPNPRKRPHNNSENSSTIVQINQESNNGNTSTALAIIEALENQSGPSNAKIPTVCTTTTISTDSAFERAKMLKSDDELENMNDMILEHERKAQEFEKLRLDALKKDEEIGHLKLEFQKNSMQMADQKLENEQSVQMHKNENESLKLQCASKDEEIGKFVEEIENRDKQLEGKDGRIRSLQNELVETQSAKIQEISDIKSKLDIQLGLNGKNEAKLEKLGQEINRKNLVIQDFQKICTNFTTEAENSFTKLLPESVEVDEN